MLFDNYYIKGCISGMSGIILSHPVDTIKTFIQTNNKINSLNVYNINNLYKGITSPLIGVGIEKAAAIASIWTNNYIANAKARAAFFATGGQPFVTINTISAILNTAATVAAAAQAMSAINGVDFQKEAPTMGKNYAMGGYIDGPRHSQGGVPIEAEGGEAIMTRGAVTAFAPLLSTLNQMGGGTSFSKGVAGQAGFDFPQTSAQDIQQPQITKTYVVENELTTMQQRQARLKDLSIL